MIGVYNTGGKASTDVDTVRAAEPPPLSLIFSSFCPGGLHTHKRLSALSTRIVCTHSGGNRHEYTWPKQQQARRGELDEKKGNNWYINTIKREAQRLIDIFLWGEDVSPPDTIYNKVSQTAFYTQHRLCCCRYTHSLYLYTQTATWKEHQGKRKSSAWKRVCDLIIYRPLHGPSNRSGTLYMYIDLYCTQLLYSSRSNPEKCTTQKKEGPWWPQCLYTGLYIHVVGYKGVKNSRGEFHCNLSPIICTWKGSRTSQTLWC